MMKKCIYCSCEISGESVVDICERCGVGVWGEKMFQTIIKNMENARKNGDLYSRGPEEVLVKEILE